MTQADVQDLQSDITCLVHCMNEKQLLAASVQLLSEGAGGGGGTGGLAGTTNMNLGGVAPPTDGTVPTYRVFDLDTGFEWYNSGTIASPTWNNV